MEREGDGEWTSVYHRREPRFANAFIPGKEFAVSSCRLKIDPRIKLGINADPKRGNWLTLNSGAA